MNEKKKQQKKNYKLHTRGCMHIIIMPNLCTKPYKTTRLLPIISNK